MRRCVCCSSEATAVNSGARRPRFSSLSFQGVLAVPCVGKCEIEGASIKHKTTHKFYTRGRPSNMCHFLHSTTQLHSTRILVFYECNNGNFEILSSSIRINNMHTKFRLSILINKSLKMGGSCNWISVPEQRPYFKIRYSLHPSKGIKNLLMHQLLP